MSISVVLLDYHIGISLPEAWQDIEILKLEIFRHFSTLSDVARDIAVKLLSPYGCPLGLFLWTLFSRPSKSWGPNVGTSQLDLDEFLHHVWHRVTLLEQSESCCLSRIPQTRLGANGAEEVNNDTWLIARCCDVLSTPGVTMLSSNSLTPAAVWSGMILSTYCSAKAYAHTWLAAFCIFATIMKGQGWEQQTKKKPWFVRLTWPFSKRNRYTPPCKVDNLKFKSHLIRSFLKPIHRKYSWPVRF